MHVCTNGTAHKFDRDWHKASCVQMLFLDLFESKNGACAHYVMVSKFQWKPFWFTTQRDPQNDWTATQNRVNYDVFAQAPLSTVDWVRKWLEFYGTPLDHSNICLPVHAAGEARGCVRLRVNPTEHSWQFSPVVLCRHSSQTACCSAWL